MVDQWAGSCKIEFIRSTLSIMKLIFGDGVEYPQIWANEVIIGPHIQPAGYFSNPAKLKNQP
jgi:hypothetical protein